MALLSSLFYSHFCCYLSHLRLFKHTIHILTHSVNWCYFFQNGRFLKKRKFQCIPYIYIQCLFKQLWATDNTFLNVVSIRINKGYICCEMAHFYISCKPHSTSKYIFAKSHYFGLSPFMYIFAYHNRISCSVLLYLCTKNIVVQFRMYWKLDLDILPNNHNVWSLIDVI